MNNMNCHEKNMSLFPEFVWVMALSLSLLYAPVSGAHEEKSADALPSGAQEQKEHHHPHKHPKEKKLTPEKAAFFLKKWESSKRKKWQRPGEIVEELGLKPGQIVADIGSGGGIFTVLFSRTVGKTGKVYAVDVEKLYLDYIEKRIEKENLSNIELVLAKYDDPLIPENSVDMIFICDAWHHIKNRDGYIWKLYRALKPEGRLVVVEFRYQQPQLKLVNLDHRVPRSETLKLTQEGGFKLHGEYFFLPRQYFLIFKKVLFPQD